MIRRYIQRIVIAGAALAWGGDVHASEDWRGVYVATRPLMSARSALPVEIYAQPGVSGIYIQLHWDKVEPTQGGFDFTGLDRELRQAVIRGKNVSLSVVAGGRSPKWLLRQGAEMFDFRIARGGQRQCQTISIAPPWNPVYQKRYAMMMRALAHHVKDMSALGTIRIVKLTGVARITEELRLPITAGRQGECGEADATARWIKAGYSPARLVSAWTTLATSVASAFPGAVLAQDVLEKNDLPAVGGRDIKRDILAAGQRNFPGRFAVQWDGLNSVGALPPTPLAARRAGAILGWQSNMRRGFEGAGCNLREDGPPSLCSPDEYAQLLRRGVESGASYIEIWPEDAQRFSQAVRTADRQLRAPTR